MKDDIKYTLLVAGLIIAMILHSCTTTSYTRNPYTEPIGAYHNFIP